MTTLREAAEMALEALEYYRSGEDYQPTPASDAVVALRTALADHSEHDLDMVIAPPQQQPLAEPVPVAWMDREGDLYKMPEIEGWAPPHTMLYTSPPQRKPLTDDDLEPLRIRIMGEAYNAADEGQSEAYNAIKVLCAVLLDLVKRAVTSLDTDNSKEAQLDYIAQQIKNVVSSFNISKSLPVADTESDVLTATYMLGLHAGKKSTNRQPLTDEEIHDCFQQSGTTRVETRRLIARAIERAHGIGGEE